MLYFLFDISIYLFSYFRVPVICHAPIVNQPRPSVTLIAGKPFAYQIPELTFLTTEGMNTRHLSLKLTESSRNFPSRCWYTFDQVSQTISGLSFKSLLSSNQNAEFVFRMTAAITCGQKIFTAATNLSLIVHRPRRHCIEIAFAFKTATDYPCEWTPVKIFAEKVAQFYGFNLEQDFVILDYSKVSNDMFTVKMTFSSNKISCAPCDITNLVNLTSKIIQKSDMKVQPGFVHFMSPEFTVNSAAAVAEDSCVPITTVGPTGSTSGPTPTVKK